MVYQIREQLSDSGHNVFIYEENETIVPLNSLYSPVKEAQRYLKKLSELNKQFIVFIGVGNGVLLDTLMQSKVFEKNVHFLFIEPFSEIKLSEKHLSCISKSNKLSFFYLKDFTSLIFAQFISKYISIPICIQTHPNYLKANQKTVRECLKIIHEGTETKQILNNTEMKFAVDWIVEPLLNIQHISKSINIKALQGKFKGERAVLIAAGPSLKEHMDFLEERQDSYHLFSVGSALRALLKSGIHPDYVLSVDASNLNYATHFEGLDYKGTLIYETMSNSNIQKHHQGSLVVSRALTDNVTSHFFKDIYPFPNAAPSVAIYTLQVIAYLGFSEVYLVGQDLALIGGAYYAEGVKHHSGMKDLKDELWVENNQGVQVGTTKALKIFLESFESLIKTLPESLKIYNLSKLGAKIEGTKYVSSNMIELTEPKKSIIFERNTIQPSIDKDLNVSIAEFLNKLDLLKIEVSEASKHLNRYIKIGLVSPDDMIKVVKRFRKVAKHQLLEDIILSRVTFMFDSIINKFAYFDDKGKYSSDDLLELVHELNRFYELVNTYINQLLADERLMKYK
ncbi:motility associated factor glycosyltransferase family protein [Cytobacillus massiliigabonensis]|uniref:motility associated factor glycosyltransferase family protein n=1 Tax=Cytobacillus massiliigabonensis TaxID=1871011 RepID=UPI0015E140A4|nr:6-hydroxymethylpterin diphosphokinase MptE-like protein [Cytobacillus massiliigabonensis]